MQQYLLQASFLPDLNLERLSEAAAAAAAEEREGARERANRGGGLLGTDGRAELLKLAKFVLILGTRDEAFVPTGSAWFQSYQVDGGGEELVEQKLMDTKVYTRLGLSELDLDGRLSLVSMTACTWQVPANTTADSWDECRREVTEHIIMHLGRAVKQDPQGS